MQVIPSILEKTAGEVLSQIARLSPYYQRFQIDIADGEFVPNKTVQIEEIISNIQRSTFNFNKLQFDFHLMMRNYTTALKRLEELRQYIKIQYVLIHSQVISSHDFQQLNNSIKKQFLYGLVLNPEDSVETIVQKYKLEKIPVIQIMSVIPGLQGQPFIPETLEKIEQLHHANYKSIIMLDGAVNESTLPIIASKTFQPDFVCPGSYLTKATNLQEKVMFLSRYQ